MHLSSMQRAFQRPFQRTFNRAFNDSRYKAHRLEVSRDRVSAGADTSSRSAVAEKPIRAALVFFIVATCLLGLAGGGAGAGCSAGSGDQNEDLCPNGRVDPGEECDFGLNSNYSPLNCYDVGDYYRCDCYCSIVDCTWRYSGCTNCGNGVLDEGEECDHGGSNGGNYCDGCYACDAVTNRCGDGHVCDDEECDDGNTIDGDGCSAQCLEE